MRDRPDGPTLRALAQEFAGDAELVERALAIAAREGASDADFAACRAALAARYGDANDSTLLLCLAAEIRSGAFDRPGPARDAVRRLLWALTRAKLAESNPDYLAASAD